MVFRRLHCVSLLYVLLFSVCSCTESESSKQDTTQPAQQADADSESNDSEAQSEETSSINTQGDVTIPRQVSQLKWKFQTRGYVSRAPVIEDGVVYCCSEDGFLYAIDLQTGQEKWKFNAHDNGIKCKPSTTRDLVYIGSDDRHVYAVNKENGWEKWSFSVRGEASEPIVKSDTLYVGTQSANAYAINALTGEEIWKVKLDDGGIYGAPTLVGNAVAFKTDGPRMHFIERKSGANLGLFKEAGRKGPLFFEQNVISIQGAYCRAYSLSNSQMLWEFKTGDNIGRIPVIEGERVFVGSYDDKMYALDIRTGLPLWNFETDGVVYCPPLVDSQSLVFGSSDGRLYALDVTSGEELWRFKTEKKIYSTPAVSDGVVVFGCQDGNIYALE